MIFKGIGSGNAGETCATKTSSDFVKRWMENQYWPTRALLASWAAQWQWQAKSMFCLPLWGDLFQDLVALHWGVGLKQLVHRDSLRWKGHCCWSHVSVTDLDLGTIGMVADCGWTMELHGTATLLGIKGSATDSLGNPHGSCCHWPTTAQSWQPNGFVQIDSLDCTLMTLMSNPKMPGNPNKSKKC